MPVIFTLDPVHTSSSSSTGYGVDADEVAGTCYISTKYSLNSNQTVFIIHSYKTSRVH